MIEGMQPLPELESPSLPSPSGVADGPDARAVSGRDSRGSVQGFRRNQGTDVRWLPAVDVLTDGEECVILLDLPGAAVDGLVVHVAHGECLVRGRRRPLGPEFQALRTERRTGFFERRFAVSPEITARNVKASYYAGVLELRLPQGAFRGGAEFPSVRR